MSKDDFDLKREIDLHTAWITHDIHSRRKRKEVKSELAEHIEDAVSRHTLEGCSEKEAFELATQELGEVKKLQRLFAAVHNKEPSKLIGRIATLLLIVLTALLAHSIPKANLSYAAQSWLTFAAQFICIVLIAAFTVREYKYIRAFFRRIHLIGKLKKLCRKRQFHFNCTRKAYTDLDNTSGEPSFFVTTEEKTLAVRFAACLKKRDTYTFTDPSSYFTTNNSAPVLVSFGYPTSGLVFKTPAEQRLYQSRIVKVNNKYVKEEVLRAESTLNTSPNIQNILCIHPLPAKVQVVRTNRAEDIFDGDSFNGYTVYSGNGLFEFLKQL